ncbi:MAG TPA: flagellar export protein FliJ [Clostridia bacterium]|nr:flagellar export protein FliJ [Clostridia bacterium]
MKKFVFTLQAVYDIALSNEKQQKNLLKRIEERLRSLRLALDRMLERKEEARIQCAKDVDEGTDAIRMAQYARYFESLDDMISAQKKAITAVEGEREKVVAALVEIRKEIKSLENLKEKQMEEYRDEVKREEEQAIGDVVSYQVASK